MVLLLIYHSLNHGGTAITEGVNDRFFVVDSNSPIPCTLIADLEVEPWVSDTPALQVPDDLLKQSIDRALVDLAERRDEEMKLYMASTFLFILHLKKNELARYSYQVS